MTSPEKLDISELPEKEKKNYKNITRLSSKDDLRKNLNDNFFQKSETGEAMVEHHDGDIIFKQKDISLSSIINRKGKHLNGKAFRIDKEVLKRYLKSERDKEGISSNQRLQLNKLSIALSVKNELGGLHDGVEDGLEGIKKDVEKIGILIEEYNKYTKKKNMKLTHNTKDGRETRRDLKTESKFRVKLLLGMKKDILKQKNPTVYRKDIDQCVRDVPAFETAWQKASLGERGYVPRILHDKKSIKKYSVESKDAIIEEGKINALLRDIALMTLVHEDEAGFRDYLEDVISGKIPHPAQNKFYAAHAADFAEIALKNPTAYATKYKWFMDPGQITGYCTRTVSGASRTCSTNRSVRDKGGDLLVNGLAAAGIIDKNNPKQVEAIRKLGKYGMIAGAAFLGFKFLQNLFKKQDDKENPNKRWKTAGYGGGLLALFNADKLINWGKDVVGIGEKGGTVDSKETAKKTGLDIKDVDTYITPQYTTAAALGGTPINTLISGGFLIENNGKIELDYDSYKKYILGQKMNKNAETMALENLEELNKDKTKLRKGLSSFGITTLDDLKDISKGDDEMTLLDSENVSNYLEGLTSPVNRDIDKEGLKPKDADAWYQLTQEFDENKKDNDDQIIGWMRQGLLEPIDNKGYKIQDIIKNPNVDLVNKRMIGFGNNIDFKGYDDLFGAVKLTDVIKKAFKKESTASQQYNIVDNNGPFHYGINTLGNIEFDDQERYKIWEDEKDVVNGNWFKNTLAEISPTLDAHKDEYIAYLNRRWKNKNKSIEPTT